MGLFSKKTASEKGGSSIDQADRQPSRTSPTSQNPKTASTNSSDTNAQQGAAYRPVYLLVWPSGLFKSHWAIFVPEASDKTGKTGKYIHVEGNLNEGFRFEIVRGWNINVSRRRPNNPIEIGWVPASIITDTPTKGGKLEKGPTPRDDFESVFASIAAPSKSLRGSESTASSKSKVELSDCQWWIAQCVKALIARGDLVAPSKGLNKGREPMDLLMAAPRH